MAWASARQLTEHVRCGEVGLQRLDNRWRVTHPNDVLARRNPIPPAPTRRSNRNLRTRD